MRLLFAVAILLQLSMLGHSQSTSLPSKPPLDSSVLGKWPKLNGEGLSPDGKYLSYVLKEQLPVDRVITVLQTPDGKWKKELKGINGIKFCSDSKTAVYLQRDTLFIIQLGDSKVTTVAGIQSYRLVPSNNSEWLVYQLKTANKELIIQDGKSKKQKRFTSVENFTFSKDGEVVILESKSEDEKESRLRWVDLTDGKENTIWTGSAKPLQVIFDNEKKQLVFTAESNGKRSVWYYSKVNNSSEQVLTEGDTSIDKGLYIGSIDKFSKYGDRVFFNLEKRETIQKPKRGYANVNVWRFNDIELQAEQLSELAKSNNIVKKYFSVLNLKNKQAIRIQRDFNFIPNNGKSDDYTLLIQLDTDQDVDIEAEETSWNPAWIGSTYYLVSNHDGSRKQLPWKYADLDIIFFSIPAFSPKGNYIVYRERNSPNYFSYEIATGISRNITAKIKTDLTSDRCYSGVPIRYQTLIPIAGWIKDDAGVLVYDRNDIWWVDLKGEKNPVNITNGYGKRNGLIFRLGLGEYKNAVLLSGQKLVLTTFNKRTKQNGYFATTLGKGGDPLLINMEMSLYAIGTNSGSNEGDIIIGALRQTKAKNADFYLVRKQTVSEYSNYYFTKDLKSFQKVTDLHPEKKYNWMSSDLYSWVAPDGDTLQGVLYKPENFDASKKYPVIFSIYRQFSDELNDYHLPEWATDRINIPWFVSNGYLVFTPDIHYKVPLPGLKASVLNCVVSAAKYIAKLPFVDSTKMGIQGHSFGGLEMGYIVTNTNVFAAACSAAGSYDLISDDGTILYGGSRQGNLGGDMIFGTLCEQKQAFIENSAIFDADKATTPLLMVAGELDGTKPYDQNIEFFLGLRRMQKPVWMLDYEDEGHLVKILHNDTKDYNIRLNQFFAHYLKGEPAPKWMSKGIPAKHKGIENGYALDRSGRCHNDCEICKMWNERWKKESAAIKEGTNKINRQ